MMYAKGMSQEQRESRRKRSLLKTEGNGVCNTSSAEVSSAPLTIFFITVSGIQDAASGSLRAIKQGG
jgi:hypothetical protein